MVTNYLPTSGQNLESVRTVTNSLITTGHDPEPSTITDYVINIHIVIPCKLPSG